MGSRVTGVILIVKNRLILHEVRCFRVTHFFVRRAWRVYLTVEVRYGGYQLPTISLRQGCPPRGGI